MRKVKPSEMLYEGIDMIKVAMQDMRNSVSQKDREINNLKDHNNTLDDRLTTAIGTIRRLNNQIKEFETGQKVDKTV